MTKIPLVLTNFYHSPAWKILIGSYLIAVVGGLGWFAYDGFGRELALRESLRQSQDEAATLSSDKTLLAGQYAKLMQDDQLVINASLSGEIAMIAKTYAEGSKLFEERADLAISIGKVSTVDTGLAKFLSLLGQKNWKEAESESKKVALEIQKIAALNIPKPTISNATASNSLPGSGYSRQKVTTPRGEFVISMITAPGAKVVIETAGDSDCSDNCPTKSLAEHVSASGGFAGINGAYFCPPDYPKCQGKVNSYDTMAVNGRTKTAFNRANNVYSTVPLLAANGNSLNFYDQTLQWGVDTGGTGAIANFPRLLRDGSLATGDDAGKGLRGFIGKKDNAIVIGHVYSASLLDTAEVLRTLGLQNAMNLDGGGSTALWYEGSYKAGPGRSLPTAIVLVR